MAVQPVTGGRRFVGRARELALIADVCMAARDGRSQLLIVSGPAGIGKTTLCRQALGRASADGFNVAWGRSWPDGGAPALWPWTAVLSELVGSDAAALLSGDPHWSAIDADRFSRFAAVANLLGSRTADAPLAIVLDDAHLADAAALLLVRFLVRTIDRCVIMLTRRDDDPDVPSETRRRLLELERDAVLVPLRSFDEHDTAAFLAAHGLQAEEREWVPTLTRLTGGSPLLLARAVASTVPDDDRGVVEYAIEDSLDALAPEHRDVIALAAILGMEGRTGDVTAMVGGDHAEVVEAFERAADAGLVDLLPGSSGATSWRFTHDLVRVASLAVLTRTETLEAHVRALDLAPVDGRPGTVARRAHHALQAAERSPADAVRAVAECRSAAKVLGRGFDYERAALLLGAAVDLVERLPHPADHVELLLEWADALLVCGRLADARRAYERAVAVAGWTGDPVARARAALGLGGVWVNEHRSEVERTRVLALQRTALAELPRDAFDLRLRLVMRLAAEDVYDGAPVEPVIEALRDCRRSRDPHVLAEALSLAHHALLSPEHANLRLQLAEEQIAIAAGCGDDLRVLFGLLWKAVDHFLAGDVRAMRTLSELRDRADAVGCRSIGYVASAIDVMQLIRDGRLDEAERVAHECFEHGVDVGDADATGYYGAHLLTIRFMQDRDSELLDLARDISSASILIKPEFGYRAGAAAIAARAGLHDEATSMLAPLRLNGLASLPRSSTWLTGIANIVEAAASLGDAELAAEAYPLLEPYADRPVMPSLAVACFGVVERALGLAALTFGDAELAVSRLEQAVEGNIRLGNRPLTAMSRADLAEALVVRGHPGDRSAAVDALRRAAEAATVMAMPLRAERWARRADELSVDTDESLAAATVLRRDHGQWVVEVGDRRAELPDLVGVGYLAVLLARPEDEVPALELCGGSDVESAFHELVDEQTLRSYRRRAAELDEQLELARRSGPRRRIDRLETEREALREELSAVVAKSGRARRFVDSGERARTAVRKAITRAIDVIAASDPALGDELRATITTGRTCVYRPRRPARAVST